MFGCVLLKQHILFNCMASQSENKDWGARARGLSISPPLQCRGWPVFPHHHWACSARCPRLSYQPPRLGTPSWPDMSVSSLRWTSETPLSSGRMGSACTAQSTGREWREISQGARGRPAVGDPIRAAREGGERRGCFYPTLLPGSRIAFTFTYHSFVWYLTRNRCIKVNVGVK